MSYALEVCVDSLESAIAAEQGGADRIELCQNLAEGGVTPSHALIQHVCRKLTECKVHVLIRPRGGDFLYSESEIALIKEDIIHCASCGAHGIVAGFLTQNGTIDTNLTSYFVELCNALGLDFTFHRAFDVVRDQQIALHALIGCQVRRVLTSGGHATAYHGIEVLSALVSESSGRISVMPGAGVAEENAATILECTGATEIHGTFRCNVPSRMVFIHPTVNFGPVSADAEAKDPRESWQRCIADENAIRRIKTKLTELATAEEEGKMR